MKDNHKFIGSHFNHFDTSFKAHCRIGKEIQDFFGSRVNLFYICPLCLKNSITVVDTSLTITSEFSKEHYPPQSVDGRNTLLVCKKCNNTAGTSYDYSLEIFLKQQAFAKRVPGTSIIIRHSNETSEKQFKGKLDIDEDGVMNFIEKLKPNVPIQPVDSWIDKINVTGNFSLTIQIKNLEENLVARALLKTAYLYCFHNFGYEFIYSEAGNKIRQVLNGEILFPLPSAQLLYCDEEVNYFEGLGFVTSPKEYQSIVALIQLALKEIGYKCFVVVPIPSPTATGWQDLEILKEAINSKKQITLTKLPVYLLENEMNGYSKAWATHYNKVI